MLAEIFMLSVEADVRSSNALTPTGNVARFVPIELPVTSAGDGPHSKSTATSRQQHSGCAIAPPSAVTLIAGIFACPGLAGRQWSSP